GRGRLGGPFTPRARGGGEATRRIAFARLRDAEVVEKLFADLGPRFKARPGGYTRILRMMPRPGDSAPMALMQLVEGAAAAAAEEPAPDKKKRTRRAKTATKAKGKAEAGAEASEAAPAEAPKKRTRKKKAAA